MRKRDLSPLPSGWAPYSAKLQELESEVVSSRPWWSGSSDLSGIPTERTIDVLSFGVDSFPRAELRRDGIAVIGMTALTLSDINHAGVQYYNREAFRLAMEVTPEDHDLLVINRDIGWAYARVLSDEMVPRALVIDGDHFRHEEGQSDEYETDLGITNFSPHDREEQAKKIVDMLGGLPAIIRPVRPDVRIRTLWPLEVRERRWDDALI